MQFSAKPLLLIIDAVGGVVFKVITIGAVLVHPLALVTVTVYVPAAVNELAAVAGVKPPFHE